MGGQIEQILRVLERVRETGERDLRVTIEPGVTQLVQRLFQRFQPYHSFRGRAVGFLREALHAAARAKSPLAAGAVLAQFTRQTGLPEWLLRDDLPLAHGEVLAHFAQRIIGQPAACRAAADFVTRFKAGLHDPARPLAVLLLCGPTGVGKTALGLALASYLFGAAGERAGERLVRIDLKRIRHAGLRAPAALGR